MATRRLENISRRGVPAGLAATLFAAAAPSSATARVVCRIYRGNRVAFHQDLRTGLERVGRSTEQPRLPEQHAIALAAAKRRAIVIDCGDRTLSKCLGR
ncbi:hypothetical protein [Aminobacter sp. HY435]|uniref:hypothetical protein n=1 Tax=Aminobacter sp. HY435 TaxID=2970917 RepID=UPI0022B962CF|nr:hypothetical protein [Aminobacter sp. HY435]